MPFPLLVPFCGNEDKKKRFFHETPNLYIAQLCGFNFLLQVYMETKQHSVPFTY